MTFSAKLLNLRLILRNALNACAFVVAVWSRLEMRQSNANMAATDGQITVAAARWADEGSYLREFVAKHRLPAVYGGLGVPTLPSPALQSAAACLRRQAAEDRRAGGEDQEGRRLASVRPRLVIPDTYAGYFELLSEEGRAVRCIGAWPSWRGGALRRAAWCARRSTKFKPRLRPTGR
ncbi:hypothetical protein NQ318_012645 [Aromia moschata]|uniref:Uncharacterized protein n=1 Tax=Aromia moschata TaxID=1265417 RepID=A0AAV8XP81_9CUCU|nr:hypothetical protein NQ318_012645 [Aromia moschata]